MRNLKRVFSLALALAMVLSMMVISSSAASTYTDFTDADEISNTEAVSVMVGIGVLEGDDNGAFNPEDILTREQAAKIICYMLLGESGAENLSTNSSTFSDVAAGRWSAGYIGYCSTLGIIAGYGDGTFGPTDELTGVQFGKMMLVALGYDPDIEGYVGTNWATNIGADMVDADIVPSGVIVSEPLSRDDAAQMCLQTLEADMVSYSSKGTTITTTDGTSVITGASSAEVVTRSGTASDYRGDTEDEIGDGYLQFCEKYFDDLVKDEDGDADEFGRPGYTWIYDGTEIATGFEDADATYTGRFTYKTLYTVIGSTVAKDLASDEPVYDVDYILNGEPVYGIWTNNASNNGHNNGSGVGPNYDLTYLYSDRTETDSHMGDRGLLIEIYVDSSDKTVTVVMINTFLAQVNGDYDESDEELTIELLEPYNAQYGYSGTTEAFEVDDPDLTLSLDDFANLADFEDEDYVLITIAADVVQTIEAATVVEGEVTAYTENTNKNNSTVSVDGTSYNYSITRAESLDDDDMAVYEYSIGDEVVLLADSYGFIIGMDDATESSSSYVYVDAIADVSSFSSTKEANAFFTDGTNEIITLNKIDSINASEYAESGVTAASGEETFNPGWYTYSVNSSGKYTLKSATFNSIYADFNGENETEYEIDASTDNSSILYGADNSTTLYATSSTIFVVVDDDDDIHVYSGYKNLPKTVVIGTNGGKIYAATSSSSSRYASYVFIDTGSDGKLQGGSSSSDVVYVLKTTYNTSKDSSDNTYYTYDAIVNGTKTTIKANSTAIFGNVGLYDDVTYDSDGYVDDATYATLEATTAGLEGEFAYTPYAAGTEVSYKSGVLVVDENSYELDDDCVIRTANGTTVKTVTASKLEDLCNDTSDYYYTNGFTISAVFDDDGYVTTLILTYTSLGTAVNTTIVSERATAIATLTSCANESDYASAQWTKIEDIITTATANINSASDTSEINTIVANAKADIDAIPTLTEQNNATAALTAAASTLASGVTVAETNVSNVDDDDIVSAIETAIDATTNSINVTISDRTDGTSDITCSVTLASSVEGVKSVTTSVTVSVTSA